MERNKTMGYYDGYSLAADFNKTYANYLAMYSRNNLYNSSNSNTQSYANNNSGRTGVKTTNFTGTLPEMKFDHPPKKSEEKSNGAWWFAAGATLAGILTYFLTKGRASSGVTKNVAEAASKASKNIAQNINSITENKLTLSAFTDYMNGIKQVYKADKIQVIRGNKLSEFAQGKYSDQFKNLTEKDLLAVASKGDDEVFACVLKSENDIDKLILDQFAGKNVLQIRG